MNLHDDLEAYALGALDPAEARAYETHLAGCGACREGLASYAPVVHALRALPVQAPGPLRATAPPARWGLGAAAALVLLGAGFAARGLLPGSDGDVAAIAAMVADRPREVALAGPVAHGSALVGQAGRRTAFVVSGLPPPAPGRGYQVWVRGAVVHSPGMLRRTADGLEVLVVPGDALAGARHVGVTIEPAGGSPARTGPAQVTGEVGV